MKEHAFSTRKLCYVALFTALNIILSSFGVSVPGGHLYLNDIVICFAALIFDPISAFIVGGVGAFFGDLIFYPMPMFVSLVTHGLQSVVISLIAGKKESLPKLWHAIAVACDSRGFCRRNHNGYGLFPRQSIYLQYARICNYEAAISDTSGGCRCDCRSYSSLCNSYSPSGLQSTEKLKKRLADTGKAFFIRILYKVLFEKLVNRFYSSGKLLG